MLPRRRGYLTFRLWLAFPCAMSVLGCDRINPEEQPDEPVELQLPDPIVVTDALRLNHVQLKGTHNSYHQRTSIGVVAEWDYEHASLTNQLELEGVRQFELDLHWNEDSGEIEVYHLPELDAGTSCLLLRDCLQQLKTWSDMHPTHFPIIVLIEAKILNPETVPDFWFLFSADVQGSIEATNIRPEHWAIFDETVLSVIPEDRIIRPDDVSFSSFEWPAVDDVRGRFLFYLSSSTDAPVDYSANYTSLAGRTMFVEAPEGNPFARILNQGRVTRTDLSSKVATTVQDGLLTRVQADTQNQLDAALGSGAHIISTDHTSSVATLDAFWFDIPGGNPLRCNPLLTTTSCTATLIEDLAGQPTYSVGGTVTGLVGKSLVLGNYPADELAITDNGKFRFTEEIPPGAPYEVTVKTAPSADEGCALTNASGTMGAEAVTDIEVSCGPCDRHQCGED